MSFLTRLFGDGGTQADDRIPPSAVDFRDAARRFATAADSRERKASRAILADVWRRLRDQAAAADRVTPRFPTGRQVEDLLGAAEREDDPMRRKAAIAPLVAMLDRVQRGLAAVGTPAEPGATWRPERPPLTPAQKDERLAEVRTDTRHAARSMTDAVRRVIAARRQRAVPLYATFSNEMRAAYAIAATDFALGLTPAAPYQPGTTTRTAPWGVFKVRSTAPPAEAPQRFAASPPLPARGELLEARLTRVQLLRLHAPARAPGAADSTEADHAIS